MPRRIFLAIVLALSVRKEGGGWGGRSIKPSLRGADILTTQYRLVKYWWRLVSGDLVKKVGRSKLFCVVTS